MMNDDRLQDIAVVPHNNETNINLRYGISICDQNFIFDQSLLCETVRNTTIYPIPNFPPWLIGVINLRGNLVSIFKIDHFLSKNVTSKQDKTTIFVVGSSSDAVGLLVADLPITINMDEDVTTITENHEDIPTILANYVNKVYKINDKRWLEIDLYPALHNLFNTTQ